MRMYRRSHHADDWLPLLPLDDTQTHVWILKDSNDFIEILLMVMFSLCVYVMIAVLVVPPCSVCFIFYHIIKYKIGIDFFGFLPHLYNIRFLLTNQKYHIYFITSHPSSFIWIRKKYDRLRYLLECKRKINEWKL